MSAERVVGILDRAYELYADAMLENGTARRARLEIARAMALEGEEDATDLSPADRAAYRRTHPDEVGIIEAAYECRNEIVRAWRRAVASSPSRHTYRKDRYHDENRDDEEPDAAFNAWEYASDAWQP